VKLTPLAGLGLFVGGVAFGTLLGLAWAYDHTSAIALSLILLVAGIGFYWRLVHSRRSVEPRSTPGQQIGHIDGHDLQSESPSISTNLQPKSEQSFRVNTNLEFERAEDRVLVRFRNVAGYEQLEFALALPRIRINPLSDFTSWVTTRGLFEWILFIVGLGLYSVTRFVSLDRFPIYFFADEAIQTVLAQELIQRGGKDYLGHFLPMFFNAYGFFNPLFTVYPQVLGLLAFGKSIVVTRGISSLITLVGAGAGALSLYQVFKLRYWWAYVLFIAITPAYFLHSRTAFETAEMTAFYTCFLLFYLLYRTRSQGYLYAALVFAAMTFYSYGNGQLVIGLTGAFFLVADMRYHIQHWRTGIRGLILLLILGLPYIQFQTERPGEVAYHMRTLDTYLFKPISFSEKLQTFVSNYAYGISPQYWYLPNTTDLARHLMKNYGHISLWTLPLMLIGLGVAIQRIKRPEYRILLFSALATPIGGVLTGISITRVLAFVVPAAMITTIGLELILSPLKKRVMHVGASLVVVSILGSLGIAMLNDSLTNGSRWYADYGLYGMQWGASQLFERISKLLTQPETKVYLSPTWANGTDVFVRYFIPNESRVQIANVTAFTDNKTPLDQNTIFIMTPEEEAKAIASLKFRPFSPETVLNYPDGSVGFYFARLQYVDNIDQIFADEEIERQKPVTETFLLGGESITVSHSRLDAGQMKDLFDKDTFTLVRGLQANPIFFEFTFPTARAISGFSADLGTFDFQLTISLYPEEGSPVIFDKVYRGLGPDPHIEVPFSNQPSAVKRIRIEIRDIGQGQVAKIHVREFAFR
jgi:hypothetical protein